MAAFYRTVFLPYVFRRFARPALCRHAGNGNLYNAHRRRHPLRYGKSFAGLRFHNRLQTEHLFLCVFDDFGRTVAHNARIRGTVFARNVAAWNQSNVRFEFDKNVRIFFNATDFAPLLCAVQIERQRSVGKNITVLHRYDVGCPSVDHADMHDFRFFDDAFDLPDIGHFSVFSSHASLRTPSFLV